MLPYFPYVINGTSDPFVHGNIKGPNATNCLLFASLGNVSPSDTDVGFHHKSAIEPCLPRLLIVVDAMPIGKKTKHYLLSLL